MNNPLPLKKPYLTVFLSVFLTLFFSLGVIWILIDDDFVKMFPDNIQSKKVWDEIQDEFGATEYLTVASSHPEILSNDLIHKNIISYISDLENIKNPNGDFLVDRVLSITNSDFSNKFNE